MKFEFLATLSAVIASGSYASAAERVCITPSAVSLQMKQLEQYFGRPLFDRSSRNVKPTPFALDLSRVADRAIADIDAMRFHEAQTPSGRVRVGVTDSHQTSLLPRAFAALRQHAPNVELHIDRGSTPDLLNRLKAGQIDLAVAYRAAHGDSTRLLWKDLAIEQFVLVAPPAAESPSPLKLLNSHPWIRLSREVIAGKLASNYVRQMVPGKPALIDLPGIDAIVAMVALGLGVSVIPNPRREALFGHPVQVVGLGSGGPRRRLAIVRRSSDADSRLLHAVEQTFVDASSAAQH